MENIEINSAEIPKQIEANMIKGLYTYEYSFTPPLTPMLLDKLGLSQEVKRKIEKYSILDNRPTGAWFVLKIDKNMPKAKVEELFNIINGTGLFNLKITTEKYL